MSRKKLNRPKRSGSVLSGTLAGKEEVNKPKQTRAAWALRAVWCGAISPAILHTIFPACGTMS